LQATINDKWTQIQRDLENTEIESLSTDEIWQLIRHLKSVCANVAAAVVTTELTPTRGNKLIARVNRLQKAIERRLKGGSN
jgi:hypothetical protein